MEKKTNRYLDDLKKEKESAMKGTLPFTIVTKTETLKSKTQLEMWNTFMKYVIKTSLKGIKEFNKWINMLHSRMGILNIVKR